MKNSLYIIFFLLGIMLFSSCRRVDTGKIMQQAVNSAREGRYAEAADLTRICLDENPEQLDALILDSFCRIKSGNNPEAKRLALYNLAKCTRLEPERFDCWFFYGWALVEAGRSKDAIVPLEEAAKMLPAKSPNRQKTHLLLGKCYLENNLHQRALSILQPLQIRKPYNTMPELYHALGMASLQAQRPAVAMKFFQNGLLLNPGSTLLLQDLAVATELYANQPATAKKYYIRLLAHLPAEDKPRRIAVQKSISRTARKSVRQR